MPKRRFRSAARGAVSGMAEYLALGIECAAPVETGVVRCYGNIPSRAANRKDSQLQSAGRIMPESVSEVGNAYVTGGARIDTPNSWPLVSNW
jgi:hypothetical protein